MQCMYHNTQGPQNIPGDVRALAMGPSDQHAFRHSAVNMCPQGEPGVQQLRGLPGGAEAEQAEERPAGAEGGGCRGAAAAAADRRRPHPSGLGPLLRVLPEHHM